MKPGGLLGQMLVHSAEAGVSKLLLLIGAVVSSFSCIGCSIAQNASPPRPAEDIAAVSFVPDENFFYVEGEALAQTGLRLNDGDYELVGLARAHGRDQHGLGMAYVPIAILRDLRRDEAREVAVLTEDFFYCHPQTGNVIWVPKFYQTDFLSIPRVATGIVRSKDFIVPAIVHDWMYTVGEEGERATADEVFRDALLEYGATPIRASAMFRAVRLGGSDAYGAEREWRFMDWRTLAVIDPPFERPSDPVVDSLDSCNLFDSHLPELMSRAAVTWGN